ncbi:MAG: hypothetical protein ACE5JX_06825 [Acidobacteriota bacterium]
MTILTGVGRLRKEAERVLRRVDVLLADAGVSRTLRLEQVAEQGGRWSFHLGNGRAFSTVGRCSGEWLSLEARQLRPDPRRSEDWVGNLLRANSRVTGSTRFALDRRGAPFLLADGLLSEKMDVYRWIEDSIQEILQLAGGETFSPPVPAHQEDSGDPGPPQVKALLEGTGWVFHQRSQRRAAIDLQLKGSTRQAQALVLAGGELRLEVELASIPSPGTEARKALGLFLLKSNAWFRTVRCCLREEGGKEAALAVVELDNGASPARIGHALSALSVVCRHCARESERLLDPEVAAMYLAMQGLNTEGESSFSVTSPPLQTQTGGNYVDSNHLVGNQ